MISWIKGDLIDSWQINNKFFILIDCHGLGYEIQIMESVFIKIKKKQISEKNIILWLKHIKKEDSDSLFGFIKKDERKFFIEILNIKGIGAQIGMSLLNKFSLNEIEKAIKAEDKKLISSVPGIGQKMTERIILELKNKLNTKIKIDKETTKSEFIIDPEIDLIFKDIELTLNSLNYQKKEIKKVFPFLIDHIKNCENSSEDYIRASFENLLKVAMNFLDKNNSN